MKQGLCLIGTSGHEFMDMVDDLSPIVRSRLQNSTVNVCAYCLYNIMQESRADLRSDHHWFICIEAFEKGNIDDLRERFYNSERGGPRGRFQGVYGQPTYPSPYLNDPRGEAFRSIEDLTRRSPPPRLDRGLSIDSPYALKRKYETFLTDLPPLKLPKWIDK
jgi:hypothetical protein